MRQDRIILLLVIVTVVLAILLTAGIGYAVEIDNPTMIPVQSDFDIEFTGNPTYIGNGKCTVNLTGTTTAKINISELEHEGDSVTAIFKIANKSSELSAQLDVQVSNTNTEYFNVTSRLLDTKLKSRTGITTLEITVELIKTPIYNDENAAIGVNILAKPMY